VRTLAALVLIASTAALAEGPSREEIAKAMKQISRGIENCYLDSFPKESERVDEKVTISFSITPPGVAIDVSVTSEPLQSEELSACITKLMMRRPIAPHPAGPDVKVKYPFIFKKSGK
jgi:hypothetical protein